MAINSKRRLISGSLDFSQEAHRQPDTFLAKGKGFYNKTTGYEATVNNANASIHNKATPGGNDDAHKLYLFVDYVSTGWKVAGETTQTHDSRTFYPRNLIQNDVEIRGTVPSNYEYDKLVRFVEHHQNSVLRAEDYNGDFFRAVEFELFQPNAPNSFYHFRPLYYRIAILSIRAGAERFNHAPTFTLRCKVLHDYLSGRDEVAQSIDKALTYKEVYGDPDIDIKNASYIAKTAISKEVAAKVAANKESNSRLGKHKN